MSCAAHTFTDHACVSPLSEIAQQLEHLRTLLLSQNDLLCTAESCTGGLIATLCTDIPGSSQWFERGFVTYSNAAKHESVGVPYLLIDTHGAVSEPVAQAMATGALLNSHAHWSIAVTGIAGPTGATLGKPVGLVWFGFAWRTSPHICDPEQFGLYSEQQHFSGNRQAVRLSTARHAIIRLCKLIETQFQCQ